MRLMDVQRQRFTEDKESYVDKSTIVILYYFLNYCFFYKGAFVLGYPHVVIMLHNQSFNI